MESKKVAIFAHDIDFQQMNFKPKRKFKNIRNYNDIRGEEFEAVLTFKGWHHDPEKVEAYELLIQRNKKLAP